MPDNKPKAKRENGSGSSYYEVYIIIPKEGNAINYFIEWLTKFWSTRNLVDTLTLAGDGERSYYKFLLNKHISMYEIDKAVLHVNQSIDNEQDTD